MELMLLLTDRHKVSFCASLGNSLCNRIGLEASFFFFLGVFLQALWLKSSIHKTLNPEIWLHYSM